MRSWPVIFGLLFGLALGGSMGLAGAQDAPPQQSADKPDQSTSSQQPKQTAPNKKQAASDKKPSTAEDNPFPEDISRKAAKDASTSAAPDAPDAPAPDATKQPDTTPEPSADVKPERKQLKLEAPEGGPGEYNPKQAAEDNRVGTFYLQSGDYKGAYGRFKEAAALNPEDGQAVWGLAEAARKLNLQQEAVQNYQVYLDAFPDGPKAKLAKKALNELSASAKTH